MTVDSPAGPDASPAGLDAPALAEGYCPQCRARLERHGDQGWCGVCRHYAQIIDGTVWIGWNTAGGARLSFAACQAPVDQGGS